MSIPDLMLEGQTAGPSPALSPRLTVLAHSGCLRVVAIWQGLGPHAQAIERVQLMTNTESRLEGITISFDGPSPEALSAVVHCYKAQPWVVEARLVGGPAKD